MLGQGPGGSQSLRLQLQQLQCVMAPCQLAHRKASPGPQLDALQSFCPHYGLGCPSALAVTQVTSRGNLGQHSAWVYVLTGQHPSPALNPPLNVTSACYIPAHKVAAFAGQTLLHHALPESGYKNDMDQECVCFCSTRHTPTQGNDKELLVKPEGGAGSAPTWPCINN